MERITDAGQRMERITGTFAIDGLGAGWGIWFGGAMRRTTSVLVLFIAGCASDPGPAPQYRMTIDELLLENARTCSSGFEYPASLVDGIGTQLVEELRCLDDNWLEFYTSCREPGCIYADGPQPRAIRPEVITALEAAAASKNDFISITAGYRDVAMQYYSRWYNENCDSSFDAAIPGQSNHQGGRAVDVRYYNFWDETLLEHGFEHPIPTDAPHYELFGNAAFRDESAYLQELSVLAFERLWNRNNPSDPIAEDGVYDAETKARLGASPVEGFPIGACPAGSGGDGWDAGPVDVGDTGTPDTAAPDTAGPDTSIPDAGPDTGLPDAGDAAPDAADDPRSDALEGGGGSTDSDRPRAPSMYSIVPAHETTTARGCHVATGRGGSGSAWLGVASVALALAGRRRA